MQGRAKVASAIEHDTLSRSTAPITHDHYPILVHTERDAQERFQEGVKKLKDEFAVLDKDVRKGGGVIARGIRIAIPALAKMEPFLSRKGEHHEPHYVKMLIAAGLPTWEEYKKQVAHEFEMSVRTVQRKLEEHRGHPKERQPRRLPGAASRKKPAPTQATTPVVYESPKELLTKRLKEIHTVLEKGTSPADANPLRDGERRVSSALTLVETTQLAIDDGLLDNVLNPTQSNGESTDLARPTVLTGDEQPIPLPELTDKLLFVADELAVLPPDDEPDEETDTESSVALKGCKIIYAPGGQAGEYAPLACNPYRGCGHKCAYCYVPLYTHMLRTVFDAGAVPRKEFLDRLRKDALKYLAAGIREQVMLCFTTDMYNPIDTSLTRPTIQKLIEHGLGFCCLTKGGSRALADIDLYRPDRDAFASTLTSLDDAFSLKWERAAALPADRIATLKAFHDRGIFTWVSLEPVLDVEASLAIVERTHEYVDLYKVGRVNYQPMTKTTDWKSYTERMMELLTRLGAAHYIKRDLQSYLPAGYPNPMRVVQHH